MTRTIFALASFLLTFTSVLALLLITAQTVLDALVKQGVLS